MFPPRNVRPDRLLELRQVLLDSGYTAAAVAERTGFATIYDVRTLRSGRAAGIEIGDSLDVLIRLFIDGAPLPHSQVADLLGAPLLGLLRELGLIDEALSGGIPALAARVLLYPTEGLYIVSDLEVDPDFPDGRPDTVYPAITKSCEVYLSALPDTPCDAFLEICSGTGIAALLSARAGGRAWAVDITQRSTDFAAFNAALNGLTNCTALCGDLYELVSGLCFDRIAAHPPYVPSLEQRQIYRDGGEDGEQITRRVLGGAREHLRPGGRLYCTCVATDRADAPLEQRVRRMLGDDASDCDVLVLVNRGESPLEYLTKQVIKNVLTGEQAQQFQDMYRSMDIEQFVGCTIVVERHAQARPPLTLRRARGPELARPDVGAVLRWEGFPREPAALRSLENLRPRLSRWARMETQHAAAGGTWQLKRVRLVVDEPLPFTLEGSPQAATFLARCDGTHTLREHRDRLVEEGAVRPNEPIEPFAEMVRSLLAAGLLEADPAEGPSTPEP